MEHTLEIFWLFLKINLLSTSGSASVALLHSEAVGTLMTEAQFIQAVGLSALLPGSDALQLAMFIGSEAGGFWGASAALLASLLPPTVLMFAVVSILHRLRRERWINGFVEGLTPAVGALMAFVSWKILKGGSGGELSWPVLGIAGVSFFALWFDLPAPMILLAAGIAGILIF
jgi:chromate transporter